MYNNLCVIPVSGQIQQDTTPPLFRSSGCGRSGGEGEVFQLCTTGAGRVPITAASADGHEGNNTDGPGQRWQLGAAGPAQGMHTYMMIC